MNKSVTQSLSQKKAVTSKLVVGFLVAAAMALLSVGAAGATPGNGNGGNGYGGGGDINIGIGGENNLVVIIINYFFN